MPARQRNADRFFMPALEHHQVAMLFIERHGKILDHVGMPTFVGQRNQRFPAGVVAQLGGDDRVQRLGDRGARIGQHL